MPAKAKKESNAPIEQLSRRRSARLAGLDKEKPAESQKSSKITTKEPAKKKSKKLSTDKMSKGDVEVESSTENKNHNNKIDISKDKSEEDTKDLESNEKKIEEVQKDDFVVVNAQEVPSPESIEVKEALKAQGEDGELLVNFVQVTHDDVPDAKVVPATVNGICTTNNLDTDKTEEPQLQVEEPKSSST